MKTKKRIRKNVGKCIDWLMIWGCSKHAPAKFQEELQQSIQVLQKIYKKT